MNNIMISINSLFKKIFSNNKTQSIIENDTPKKELSLPQKEYDDNKHEIKDKYNLINKKEYQSIGVEKLNNISKTIEIINKNFISMLEKITYEIQHQNELIIKSKKVCYDTKPYFNEVKKKTEEIARTAKSSSDVSRKGKNEISQAINEIISIRESVEDINNVSNDLIEQSSKIEKLINTITEIADNTKIIAFNSSIASSKAGSTGRSFSVVSSEIKSLSNKTTEQVNSINEAINLIRDNTEKLVDKMNNSLDKVSETKSVVENSEHILKDIVRSIEKTDAVSITIKSMTNNLSEKNNNILDLIEYIQRNVRNLLNLSESSLSDTKQTIDSINIMKYYTDLMKNISYFSNEYVEEKEEHNEIVFSSNEQVSMDLVIDPALITYSHEHNFNNLITIKLAKYSLEKNVIPYLAENWKLEDDEKTWVFYIKKDLKFINGKPITAKDVKFSLERALNPKLGSKISTMLSIIDGTDEYINGKSNEVSGIKIVDNYTIKIKLKNPANFFLSILTHPVSSILSKDDTDKNNPIKETIVSAGPFYIENYVKNDENKYYELKSNKDYVFGKPYIDKYFIYYDRKDILKKYKDNYIDFFYGGKSAANKLDEDNIKYKILEAEHLAVAGLSYNFKKDNFLNRNKEARAALGYAIDKNRIKKEAYNDFCTLANSILHPSIMGEEIKNYPDYDPDKAKKILSNINDNISETITICDFSFIRTTPYNRIINIISENLRDIGLNIKVDKLDYKEYGFDTFSKYDIVIVIWVPEVDYYLALEPFINPNGSDNYFKYNNKELFNELNESLVIRNHSERKEYFKELLRKISNDPFMIPLVFTKHSYIFRDNVKNINFNVKGFPIIEDIIIDKYDLQDNSKKININPNLTYHVMNNQKKSIIKTDYSVKSVNHTNNQLISGIYKIIDSINEEQKSIDKVHNSIDEFMKLSDFVKEQTKNTLKTIDNAIFESGKGKQISRSIIFSLNQLKNSIGSVNQVINLLKGNIINILKITQSMKETTDNINSIAINAAIIAAKAGKWRNEFINVSKEVRILSTRTSNEIDKIEELLELMNSTINNMELKIDKSITKVDSSISNINKSDEILLNITEVIEQTQNISNEISSKISNLSGVIKNIYESIDTVNTSSNHTFKVAQSVNFGTELQTSIITTIKNLSERMNILYNILENAIIDFQKENKNKISSNKTTVNILKVGIKPLTLNPFEVQDIESEMAVSLYTDNIINQSDIHSLSPSIAKSWSLGIDNKTWIFNIRDDVYFHDNQKLSLNDVKYCIEKSIKEFESYDELSTGLKKIIGIKDFIKGNNKTISGIKTDENNNKLIFELTEEHSIFDNEVANYFVVLSNDSYDFKNKKNEINSCGAFIYKGNINETDDNSQSFMKFISNKRYFNGEPFIDEIRLYHELDNEINAFINKDIDIIQLRTEEDILKIKDIPEYKETIVEISPFVSFITPSFKRDNPFTKHKELRQAMLYAIDRNKIVKEAYNNRAIIQQSYLQIEDFVDSPKSIIYNYNPDKASKIINETEKLYGNINKREFTLAYHNSFNDYRVEKMIDIIIQNLSDVGINILPVKVKRDDIVDDKKRMNEWDFSIITASQLSMGIFSAMEVLISGDFNGYENPLLKEKLDKILKLKDPEKRRLIFLEIGDKISDELPLLHIIRHKDYFVYQPHLKNVNIRENSYGIIDLKNIWISKK